MVGAGQKLIQAGHFAAKEVATRVQQLEVALDHLQTEAAQRRRRLQQALEVQQISVEVREVLWAAELAREHWECMELQDDAHAGSGGRGRLYFQCFF